MLEEVFGKGLNKRIAVYVPHTRNVHQPLTDEVAKQYTLRTLKFLGGLFGGATAFDAYGIWNSESGAPVIEKITVVYAFSDQLTRDAVLAIRRYAIELRAELQQESIAVEFNGKMFFS